jgi:hypothetical protein
LRTLDRAPVKVAEHRPSRVAQQNAGERGF